MEWYRINTNFADIHLAVPFGLNFKSSFIIAYYKEKIIFFDYSTDIYR